jgi:pyrroline-5-carboxylate reductase
MNNIVCIGSGNMGYALMKGACKNTIDSKIFFTDTDLEKAKAAANSLKAEVLTSNIDAVKKGDYIFLAVKPQVLSHVLAEISGTLEERLDSSSSPVFISMAAGWSIEKIQAACGGRIPVIRIMPNTPALIGKGMIALAASSEVPAEKIAEIKKLLSGAGIVDLIEERFMNAVTGLSGSGPAFVYLFIEALAEGGIRAGLPQDKALSYAAQTVFGAAAMVQETAKLPDELIKMVTSPGGTTLAGLAVLKEEKFSDTVMKAVTAAKRRAEELG